MQAFLYRHLVTAKQLLLYSKGVKWKVPPIRIINETPVKIKSGSDAGIFFKAGGKSRFLNRLKIKLDNPPEGITVTNINLTANGFEIKLHTDKNIVKPGYKDNLIFAVYRNAPKRKNKKGRAKNRNFRMSSLPAVPIEIY